jgi:hypothetical protein
VTFVGLAVGPQVTQKEHDFPVLSLDLQSKLETP